MSLQTGRPPDDAGAYLPSRRCTREGVGTGEATPLRMLAEATPDTCGADDGGTSRTAQRDCRQRQNRELTRWTEPIRTLRVRPSGPVAGEELVPGAKEGHTTR